MFINKVSDQFIELLNESDKLSESDDIVFYIDKALKKLETELS